MQHLKHSHGLILCHIHPSGDPTPQPKDRRQLHRWLIGIDEEGIFINPALLARAGAFVATASNRPGVTQVTCMQGHAGLVPAYCRQYRSSA